MTPRAFKHCPAQVDDCSVARWTPRLAGVRTDSTLAALVSRMHALREEPFWSLRESSQDGSPKKLAIKD